jgi:PAS domain-containing protein
MGKTLDQHHEDVVRSFYRTQQSVFDSSAQPMFLYLDDVHKMCNERFARLLGYKSADEWGKVERSFTDTFVEQRSRKTIVSAYKDALERRCGTTSEVIWKKKGKGTVDTTLIMVPIIHKRHVLTLNFISDVK